MREQYLEFLLKQRYEWENTLMSCVQRQEEVNELYVAKEIAVIRDEIDRITKEIAHLLDLTQE